MSPPLRITDSGWIIALAIAGGFLLWLDGARIHRVEAVTGMVGTSAVADPASPTGYAGGLRQLIVPEHNNDSYQWIAQTQQMLAHGEWHVRHVDYDNAPLGREVRSPSPYRWWLGLVAWIDHKFSGRSIGQSIERAALYSDAGLHLLLLVGMALFAAWQFGALTSALLSIALAAVFPFGGAFLPGQPDDHGLSLMCAVWSVLPLLAAFRAGQVMTSRPGDAPKKFPRWFAAAGIAGGLGLWVNPPKELLVLTGVALGGVLFALLTRRDRTSDLPTVGEKNCWRVWAVSGAATTLVACLLENLPANLGGLRMDSIHSLYGLGWLGAGELLAWTTAGLRGENAGWKLRDWRALAPAALAVAATAAAIALSTGPEFMQTDSLAKRLTNLSDGAVADNVWTWISHDGFTAMAAATFVPVLLLIPAIWLLVRRGADARQRAAISLALGPVVLALVLALFELRWWNMLDGMLLVLLAATAAALASGAKPTAGRWILAGGVMFGLAPGAALFAERAQAGTRPAVTEAEVVALVERDLAHWLANQTGGQGAVVLAPPNLTTSFYFHGGLTGLGTPYRENKDGFGASVRIAGATSPDEALAVARHRQLTHIVVPSWDAFLDEYARLGAAQSDHSLIASLHRWLPPRWLRPVPYHVPAIPGFEGQSVVIFEVVAVQDNPTAMSHLAEYFVEMGQLDQAAAAGLALKRLFPGDLGAVVARVHVERARGDSETFSAALDELQAFLARGDDRALSWDRRVSLAIALAEGKKFDAAREQVRRCLTEIDAARIRSLTTDSLYRLQVLCKAFGFSIPDQSLRELARGLLPAEMRDGL